MELNQYASIVALARMCGIEGTNKEIYDKFLTEYQSALSEPLDAKDAKDFTVFPRSY